MRRLYVHIIWVALLLPVFALANANITGTVTDAETGEPLPGVNVMLQGTDQGAATDQDGNYTISGVTITGEQTVMARMIGYRLAKETVMVPESGTVTVNFTLQTTVIRGNAIAVVADRARERETPVAFTNVEKEELEYRLGSRDLPLILNTTPSVYSTNQGGGAGDARLSVRGFNQRNVAIMINGVPVNDMENGWVYWSNWDGIGDATQSIQMQRGLSAVNLAVPSIGGTMNIITDPAGQQPGVRLKQEVGNDGFLKTTLMGNTGLINDKYALSAGLVRKIGDGYVDKTWIDAWAYYFGASYNLNANNRLEFYALGAPQRHGQNLYKQNIGVYSHEYANDLTDYDPDALNDYPEAESGLRYNQNWGPVNPSYNGDQAWNGKTTDRYSQGFINERENFYHKPQVNLNWYTKLSEKLRASTILYYSGGTGGGTGTYGSLFRRDANGKLGDDDHRFYFGPSPWQWDWDATISMNEGGAGYYIIDQDSIYKEDGQSIGILRNSRNNQWTIGAISKAYYEVSNSLKLTVGLDWRTAEIEHYREVRDLLGGEYWVKTADQFNPNAQVGLGDKVAYNFTNTVDWLGFFGQGEYTSGRISAYGMAGYSTIAYTYTNHFVTPDTLSDGSPDPNGSELTAESGAITGGQVKGGASFRLTESLDIFSNVGYVSKVPIFDNVISDRDGTKAKDPKNEKFTSFEAGANWRTERYALKANYYYTIWEDRANSISVDNPDGSEGLVFITGMNSLHSGLEFEASAKPMDILRFDAAAGFGNWTYTDDVEGVYKDYEAGGAVRDTARYYVKDLKVGNSPQTQLTLSTTVMPMEGLSAQLVLKRYMDFYADWDPFSREDPNDRTQSWQVPSYNLVDLHASYRLPFTWNKVNLTITGHVFNLLDTMYLQDAVDNSQYNSFDQDHDADDAEVFFGTPRTWNVGLSLSY
mgnify:CR=1 FL=1